MRKQKIEKYLDEFSIAAWLAAAIGYVAGVVEPNRPSSAIMAFLIALWLFVARER